MAKKRKKGEGTVRQRKDGRWEGRVVVGYDDSGNPKTKNVLAKTKKECVEKLEALKKERGSSGPIRVGPEMRFGDWLDFWYQNCSKPGLRHTTQLNYENWIYLHTIPGVGEIPLNRLSQSDLQQFFTEMKKGGRMNNVERHGAGMADRSVRSCHAVCQMALDKAVKDGLIRTNPAVGCKLPPIRGKEMKVLTKEEIQRFLIQAKAEGMYEMFLLELTTGMRRGELLALKWSDLDLKTDRLRINKQVYSVNGKLEINEPKTKAAVRTILLPPAMVELLAEYKAQLFSEWMFPSRIKPEQPVDPGYIRKRLQVILKRAECKTVRFHDLRHTFATISLENGMDVKTLSTIIGHVSSATTLNIYTHITDEMRRNAARNIDQGIAGVEIQEQDKTEQEEPAPPVEFTPYKPLHRRPGTGCVSKINDHLWEGRYSPKWIDGKKHARNIYAHTREECEEKLAVLIVQMKRELAELKAAQTAGTPSRY